MAGHERGVNAFASVRASPVLNEQDVDGYRTFAKLSPRCAARMIVLRS